MTATVTRPRLIASAAVVALASTVVLYSESIVLRGYRDPIGIVTACAGHTRTATMRPYTLPECARLLRDDLAEHDERMMRCVRVPLSDGEHAGYLSFSFNVGTGAFCTSTLARKLNAGDRRGACAELSRWVYAGGEQLPGLVTRRAAERELCESELAP